MGYARASQTAQGIHQRLRARAFVIATNQRAPQSSEKKDGSENKTIPTLIQRRENSVRSRQAAQTNTDVRDHDESPVDPNATICFVSIDAGMGSDLLTLRVVQRLQDLLSTDSQNSPCQLENLSISGTHTHSAPAGFLQYALFQVTSLGFSEEVVDACK